MHVKNADIGGEKRRRVGWPPAMLAACVAAIWLIAATPAARGEELPRADGPVRSLRVVTLNLFHGGPLSGIRGNAGDLDLRLEAVARELHRVDPDIIALQEASKGWGRGNVAARLAERLGLHFAYAPSNPHILGSTWISRGFAALMNFAEGPAILSRFPILDWKSYQLPACGRFFERHTVLSATLKTPFGLLRVYSAHTLGDPCQTRAVADVVRQWRGPLPEILMGDFNAVETSAAIAAFTEEAGFVDLFRVANPDQPGFTVWQRIASPAPTVGRRVDYLFTAPGTMAQGRVLRSRLILNAPQTLQNGTSLWPSDHYGVMADLEILRLSQTASPGR